jgi:hypothetical protein
MRATLTLLSDYVSVLETKVGADGLVQIVSYG